MFGLFKILFLLASFLPFIFANCTSGEITDNCCSPTYIKNGYIDLSNVTKIGTEAFKSCKSLTSVSFGQNLTSIDSFAFHSTGITQLELPDSLKEISYSAFELCKSLTSVRFGKNLTSIGRGAFEQTGITQLELPDSLQKIDAYAFWLCTNLTSVSFGQNLTSIGNSAFELTGITNISMPRSLYEKFNTSSYGLSFIVDKTYSELGDKSIRLESYNEKITDIYNCTDPSNKVQITSNCKYSNTINNNPTNPPNRPNPPIPNLSTLEIVLIVILSVILVGGIIGIAFLIKNKCLNCNKNMEFTKQVDRI